MVCIILRTYAQIMIYINCNKCVFSSFGTSVYIVHFIIIFILENTVAIGVGNTLHRLPVCSESVICNTLV